MHNRQDITETNLKPALLEGKNSSDRHVQPRGLCDDAGVSVSSFQKHGGKWRREAELGRTENFCLLMLSCCLVSAVGTQTVFLEAQVATFTRHRTRLAVVRAQKEKARLDMLGENKPGLARQRG